jgi:DNA-directed RNA polymerase specialized sigma24 family protein
MDLVREYASCNSETAFAKLVHRHINFVYSVALRFIGNYEDAQDAIQAVFIILAQKAPRLIHEPSSPAGCMIPPGSARSLRLLRKDPHG